MCVAALGVYRCSSAECHHAYCYSCYSAIKHSDRPNSLLALPSPKVLPTPEQHTAVCQALVPFGTPLPSPTACYDHSFVLEPFVLVHVCAKPSACHVQSTIRLDSRLQTGCGFFVFDVPFDGRTGRDAMIQKIQDLLPMLRQVEASKIVVLVCAHSVTCVQDVLLGSDLWSPAQLLGELFTPLLRAFLAESTVTVASGEPARSALVLLNSCQTLPESMQACLDDADATVWTRPVRFVRCSCSYTWRRCTHRGRADPWHALLPLRLCR
jgi:hypothetical protein